MSVATLNWAYAKASQNKQSCARCGRMLALPDHSRGAAGSLSMVAGQTAVDAFVVELIAGISSFTTRDGNLDVRVLDYSKLHPELQRVYRLASKHGGVAAAISILIAIVTWLRPFLEIEHRHWRSIGQAEHEHELKLAEIEAKASADRELLRLEHELKEAERRSEHSSLSARESELLEWLRGIPTITASSKDNTLKGALIVLQEFLDRFNNLNDRLRALEESHKQSLLDAAGHAERGPMGPSGG